MVATYIVPRRKDVDGSGHEPNALARLQGSVINSRDVLYASKGIDLWHALATSVGMVGRGIYRGFDGTRALAGAGVTGEVVAVNENGSTNNNPWGTHWELCEFCEHFDPLNVWTRGIYSRCLIIWLRAMLISSVCRHSQACITRSLCPCLCVWIQRLPSGASILLQ